MNRAARERIAKIQLQEQCSELADVLPVNRMIHSRDVKKRKLQRKRP